MEMNKSQWVTDGDNVRLAMPLTKVDKENRLVSGYATLDNADSQGDVVLAEASAKAFSRFRGNIREMHQPIAVGRIADFKEDEFYDSLTQKFYRGVYVTAYISKGAQDTWEKVLDGTLTGFSIGGNILDSSSEFSKDAAGPVRFVKDYDLIELSLVDNPANQLANVFSITKSADGSIIKSIDGMVMDVTLENVFWCSTDEIAKTSRDESLHCTTCGRGMQNIGWFESEGNYTEKVRDIVTKFLEPNQEAEKAPEQNEGGDTIMADKDTENQSPDNAEVTAEVDAAEQAAAGADEAKTDEPAAEPEAETAAEVSETNTDEPNFEKLFDDLAAEVKKAVSDSNVKTEEVVTKVQHDLVELSKALETKTTDLQKGLTDLDEKLENIKTESTEVTKRLGALEDGTAIRKSAAADTTTKTNDEPESFFKGAFLRDF